MTVTELKAHLDTLIAQGHGNKDVVMISEDQELGNVGVPTYEENPGVVTISAD